MKALTVRQPHASLVALNLKPIETRSWATKYRGPLLIHAGATAPKEQDIGPWHVWNEGGHVWWLDGRKGDPESSNYFDLPLGAIVASCKLVDCVPIVTTGEEAAIRTVDNDDNRSLWLVEAATDYQQEWGEFDQKEITDQKPYGDFTPGRFAWLLEDIKPVEQRCPACWGAEDPVFGWVCPVCKGANSCDPIPAKGKQGLWEWTP